MRYLFFALNTPEVTLGKEYFSPYLPTQAGESKKASLVNAILGNWIHYKVHSSNKQQDIYIFEIFQCFDEGLHISLQDWAGNKQVIRAKEMMI